MDAGVPSQPPQILFSIPDGSAPLTYGSNGQFQMPPGGSSVQGEGPSHGDTDSSGEGASVSDKSSTLQESEAVTEQQATPSNRIYASESFTPSTPSLTRVPHSPVTTTTTTTGSAKKLFSNQVPTPSFRSSLPLFEMSSETRGLFTDLTSLSPKSFSPASFSQSESVSPSATPTSTAPLMTFAPAVSAKVSNSGVQPSSWYLAVIFGTIAGVAFLIFFISVIIFTCRKRKRRRIAQNVDVPWARLGDEEEGRLFFGSRSLTAHSADAAINSGQRRDLAHAQLRTSARELAVPVGSCANEPGYTLHDHPIPGSSLFSDEPLPPRSEELTFGPHRRPTNALRLLPSHLIDEEVAARAMQEDGPYSALSCRPARLRKRSRGHLDDAIDVNPYVNPPSEHLNPIRNGLNATPTRQHLVDRLRNLGTEQGKEHLLPWDRLPTPGRGQSKEDKEPWAPSFKASLFNAFNALASGLKPHASPGEYGPDCDRLTQVPTRHRLSTRSSGMMPFLRRASAKSPSWILHERDDGTGTVQFLPALEKHYDRSTPTPGGRLVPVLSFRKGGVSPPSSDEKGDFQRKERLIYPRAPFLPATAHMVHPHRNKHTPSPTKRNPISRDSSFYSTSSLTTLKRGRLAGIPVLDQDSDVVVLEPDFFSSRSSSPISR